MTFLSTNKSNPCPVCNDTTGKCRERLTSFSVPNRPSIDASQFFCMASRTDTDTYKFTGESSDRLWGKFISHDLSQSLSHAWGKGNNHYSRSRYCASSKPPLVKRPAKPKKRTFSHLLSIGDRHIQIQQLLAQLSLTPAHHRGLIKRGFTDQQIQQYGFKSVGYQQPLNKQISDCEASRRHRLAGVASGGKSLTNGFSGLIVPIRNAEGLYIGWQYRLDRSSGCRYLWAASDGLSSHLQEYSELPLSFCFPDAGVQNTDYIGLTEGVGFKPQLTANRFGLISLGASGGLFAASPKLLKSYLLKASNMLHTRSVLLFPDAGAVRNPLVLKQYKRTIDLISNLGFTVAIAWWGQVNKSHPDPDEFGGEYRIISPDAFFTYGLRYSAYFPDKDNRNLVKQFFDLLSSADTHQLQQAISSFKSQYQPQFDLIKRICWQHLTPQRKQFISLAFA